MDQERDQSLIFSIDGVEFSAREEPDLSWLSSYGKVFYVFDQQTSGNLCFGVEGPYGRLFIKYAGAKPVRYSGRTEDAVKRLIDAMAVYRHAHPAMIPLLGHGPTREGYAAIFPWLDLPALHTYPPSDRILTQVRRLPWHEALKMLDMIYDLHLHLAENGYIAVDFRDNHLFIDFIRSKALLCDLDLYRKKPAVNDRGRMPGSSRFMAPEEYIPDAPLDESTTVFSMGALAFEFFGDNTDRRKQDWIGPPALFEVAKKATQEKREKRYPSLRSFLTAWREGVALTPLD